MYISFGAKITFSSKKGEFDRYFNRLDRPVEESRPDRQLDRPVDPTGFHLCCRRGHFFLSRIQQSWGPKV